MKKFIIMLVLAVISFTAMGQSSRTPDKYKEYKMGKYTLTLDSTHSYIIKFYGEDSLDEMGKVYEFMETNQEKLEAKLDVKIFGILPCRGTDCGHFIDHIHVRMQDREQYENDKKDREARQAREKAEMNERLNSLNEIF